MIRDFRGQVLVALGLVACALTACKSDAEPRLGSISASAKSGTSGSQQGSSSELVALDSVSHAADWERIRSAFRQELQPDPPPNDPDPAAYRFKRIARAWRYGDAAIVVLEKRSEERSDSDRLFELYNYDFAKNSKAEITTKWLFWLWKFRKLAFFEKGPIPDITFEADSCSECEPVVILSSLRFDERTKSWKLRRWASGDDGIAIYDTGANVDGSDPEYSSLSGIADFKMMGLEQVAVWTRYREFDEKNPGKAKPLITELNLFGYGNGEPVKIAIKDKAEMNRIKKLLSMPHLERQNSRISWTRSHTESPAR